MCIFRIPVNLLKFQIYVLRWFRLLSSGPCGEETLKLQGHGLGGFEVPVVSLMIRCLNFPVHCALDFQGQFAALCGH